MARYRSEGINKNKKIRAERKKPLPLELMKMDEHEHIYVQRSQLRTDCYCCKCGQQKPQHIIDMEIQKDMSSALPGRIV